MKDKAHKKFHAWLVYVLCLICSLIFMFFFGLNSPLHTFNSHCDYQWYMTMGRGILAGKIPYRDLFEHKGPLVYAVFAVAGLFQDAQIAVWVFEVLCVSLYLYFGYQIALKFLSPWSSLAVLPLLMMILSTNYCRGLEGSCVEEFCLPIFMYGLLCFLDFIMDHRKVTWRRSLAMGICLGILLWTKYLMWEFFFIPMLIWFVVNLSQRKFNEIMRAGLIMIVGIAVISIPILIGFAAVGALDDLFMVYFQLNMTRYSADVVGLTEVERFIRPWTNLLKSFLIGIFFFITLCWGVICFAVKNWHQKSGWQMLIAVVGTWLLVGFFGGLLYYYLPLFAYTGLGAVYIIKMVVHVFQTLGSGIKRPWVKSFVIVLVTVVSFFVAFPFVTNRAEINRPREDYAPLVVAEIISKYNQTAAQPATLFTYQMADAGFYNAAGIIPNMYYYANHSFTQDAFPEMYQSFDETIRSQLCDFVITYRRVYLDNQEFLSNYYHPYFDYDLEASTLPFNFFEPVVYGHSQIVILFRN